MEQKSQLITKKIWKLVRVMFFMLKKGIIKRKFLVDLNMIKRGKIAGKASVSRPPLEEYEFSCNNTPSYPLSLFSTHKKRQKNHHRTTIANNTPLVVDDIVINSAVFKALNMLTSGKSPLVEQTGIMDSPFQATNYGEDDIQVDNAAERFIRRFYNDRRLEN